MSFISAQILQENGLKSLSDCNEICKMFIALHRICCFLPSIHSKSTLWSYIHLWGGDKNLHKTVHANRKLKRKPSLKTTMAQSANIFLAINHLLLSKSKILAWTKTVQVNRKLRKPSLKPQWLKVPIFQLSTTHYWASQRLWSKSSLVIQSISESW